MREETQRNTKRWRSSGNVPQIGWNKKINVHTTVLSRKVETKERFEYWQEAARRYNVSKNSYKHVSPGPENPKFRKIDPDPKLHQWLKERSAEKIWERELPNSTGAKKASPRKDSPKEGDNWGYTKTVDSNGKEVYLREIKNDRRRRNSTGD